MSVRLSILASVVLLTTVSAAGAQEKKKESEPKEKRGLRVLSPARCTIDGKDVQCTNLMGARFDSVLAKRAALGIQLSSTGSLRDTIGVFIARVTPKGPAETAGIVEGERIVAINAVDLRLNSADAGDSYASGLASRRLARELQKLTPGTRVNLRVWSGGRIRDVQVTAGSARDLQESNRFGYSFDGVPGGFNMGDMPRFRIQTAPRLPNGGEFRFEDIPDFDFENLKQLKETLPKEIKPLRDRLQLL